MLLVVAGETPTQGLNPCGELGTVFLYREVKRTAGEFQDATETKVVCDGHIVEASDGHPESADTQSH